MSNLRLCLNLGNTSIQWGVWEAESGWVAEGRVAAGAPERTWPELAGLLREAGLREGLAAEAPVVASRSDADLWLGSGALFLERSLPLLGCDFRAEIPTQYHDPTELGQDRVANIVAARAEDLYPCLILDAGTCLTADVLDMDGLHLGGAIAAGGPALLAGVLGRAPHLATAAEKAPDMTDSPEWGRSTEENLALGWEIGLVGIAEALAVRYWEMTDSGGDVILTGGDAEFLVERLMEPALVRPLLTLEGLRLAYEGREHGGQTPFRDG
jgi:type III pantothenate kinase